MAQRKRKAPAKRPASQGKPRTSKGGGSRVSVSGSVSPKFTLFGGSFLSFQFGGRGKGRGRSGGFAKRAAGFLATGVRGLSGKGATAGRGMGKGDRPGGFGPDADSFSRFKASRPDLFDEGAGHVDTPPDITVTAHDLPDVVDAEVVDDVPPDRGSPWLRRQIDPPGGDR